MADKKGKLSTKQYLFATLVGSTNLSMVDCYKRSYQADNMNPASIRKEAYRLAASPHIAPIIKEYSDKKAAVAHSQALSQAVSDRDRVLSKLRHYTDNAESEANAIRATVELGRTCNVFTDTVEIKSERSSEDIMQELQTKLDQLTAMPTEESDQVH